MFEELIQNGYVLGILTQHRRSDWPRLVRALLVVGAKQLQSDNPAAVSSVERIEAIAYNGEEQSRQFDQPRPQPPAKPEPDAKVRRSQTIRQCAEELRMIKEGLSRLDEKVRFHGGDETTAPSRSREDKENLGYNHTQPCPSEQPKQHQRVLRDSNRAEPERNLQSSIPAQKENTRSCSPRRQTRTGACTYSEAAKEARGGYTVADLRPVKMVFEKKEFSQPYVNRFPQPVVVTKIRMESKPVEPQPTQTVKRTNRSTEKKFKPQPWYKGIRRMPARSGRLRPQEPTIAPKYLQNVQSKIKERLEYDRHLSRVKKEVTYQTSPPQVSMPGSEEPAEIPQQPAECGSGAQNSMLEIADNFLTSSIINHFSRDDSAEANPVVCQPSSTMEYMPPPQPLQMLSSEPTSMTESVPNSDPRVQQTEGENSGQIWQNRIDEESSYTGSECTSGNCTSSGEASSLSRSYVPNENAAEEIRRSAPGLELNAGRMLGAYVAREKGHYSTDMGVERAGEAEFTLNAGETRAALLNNYLI